MPGFVQIGPIESAFLVMAFHPARCTFSGHCKKTCAPHSFAIAESERICVSQSALVNHYGKRELTIILRICRWRKRKTNCRDNSVTIGTPRAQRVAGVRCVTRSPRAQPSPER
jgi:hypothetical protein